MIGYLHGQPLVQKDSLILLVNGVGYQVHATGRVLAHAATQTDIALYIYTHVREDIFELYGFTQAADKEMFELLLSVSGVGPRIALAISEYGPEAISQAVQTANVGLFTSVPRVGKKVAQKIIIELKSKLGSLYELELGPQSQQQQDVTEALLALGFNEAEVHQVLPTVVDDQTPDTAQAIKAAIKLLTSSKK